MCRLLSLGGREGPGQQINGDYELLQAPLTAAALTIFIHFHSESNSLLRKNKKTSNGVNFTTKRSKTEKKRKKRLPRNSEDLSLTWSHRQAWLGGPSQWSSLLAPFEPRGNRFEETFFDVAGENPATEVGESPYWRWAMAYQRQLWLPVNKKTSVSPTSVQKYLRDEGWRMKEREGELLVKICLS